MGLVSADIETDTTKKGQLLHHSKYIFQHIVNHVVCNDMNVYTDLAANQ